MAKVRAESSDTLSIAKQPFRDYNLSLFARGLLTTILALMDEDGEGFELKGLYKLVPDDPEQIQKGIMELRRLGYCQRVTLKDGSTEYTFSASIVRMTDRVRRRRINKKISLSLRDSEITPDELRDVPESNVVTPEMDWDSLPKIPRVEEPKQVPLINITTERKATGPHPEIPSQIFNTMMRICYLVESEADWRLVGNTQKGKITQALHKLLKGGADLGRLHEFEAFWDKDWRSRDRLTGAYQPPRPEQVVENWTIAMNTKNKDPNKSPTDTQSQSTDIDLNLIAMMQNRNK